MRLLTLHTALLVVFFTAACAQPIPREPGVWVLTGRVWTQLAAVEARSLRERLPHKVESLRAVVPVNKTDRPRIVFVETAPAQPLALAWRNERLKWESRALTAIPHESREGVTELAWRENAPPGLLLLRSGRRTYALRNGSDAWLSLATGLAEEKAEKLDAAEAALREAVAAAGDLAAPHAELARFLAVHKRDLSTARRVIEQAIALAADNRERARYHSILGDVHLADGDPARGLAAVEQAIELDLTAKSFHRQLNRFIDAIQPQGPADVLRAFYTALSREAWGDAADLSLRLDVGHLKDEGRLTETFANLAPRRSVQDIDILRELRHGKVAYYKYTYTAADGRRRESELRLHFIDNAWKVGLE